MARHPVCETCKWYDHNANFADNAGLCRVEPPRMAGTADSKHQNPEYAVWPITHWEDWCGRHEIRTKE